MKQIARMLPIVITALGLAAVTACVFPLPAAAQDEAAFIGVLDREYVYEHSKAGSALLKLLAGSLKKLDKDASDTGKKFREEQKKINDDCKSSLSEAECKAKIDAFGEKVKAAEAEQNAGRKQLEKQRVDGRDKITKALEPIITKIIKERKLLLVVDRAALVYAAESLDITEESLKALDANLPKI
jgi:Skp family chaperone for outer membrane proteins